MENQTVKVKRKKNNNKKTTRMSASVCLD